MKTETSNAPAAKQDQEKDNETSFVTLSIMGEMFRVRKKQYNNFNDVLSFVQDNVQEGKPLKEQLVALRRQYVMKNGDKQGKVIDL